MELGPELVALKAWEELCFTPMLEALGINPSAIAIAQLMVSNRLIEPFSECALIDWSHRTALPELLDIRLTKTARELLYRASDDLMALRKAIEAALRQSERVLFSLSRSVILYDLSNSYAGSAMHGASQRHARLANDAPPSWHPQPRHHLTRARRRMHHQHPQTHMSSDN